MLTRREKLLIRPWQLRRYNNHRKKVLTALPAIDLGPPPQRGHVTCKLKKLQREGERRSKIEEDNFKLLQRMGAIMKKNRLDNRWENEPPTFLRRVGIYHRTRSPSPSEETASGSSFEIRPNRKARCSACTPVKEKTKEIPEERIPWEPPKKTVSRRRGSSAAASSPTSEKSPECTTPTRSHPVSAASKSRAKSTSSEESYFDSNGRRPWLPDVSPRSRSATRRSERQRPRFVLERGALQLAVDFPPDADVKVTLAGNGEKYLQRSRSKCDK